MLRCERNALGCRLATPLGYRLAMGLAMGLKIFLQSADNGNKNDRGRYEKQNGTGFGTNPSYDGLRREQA
jgi:hypothetical protein